MNDVLRLHYETEKAVRITAHYDEFEPPVDVEKVSKAEQWRRAYFELLSWKNTWGTRVDLLANHNHVAYVEVYPNTNAEGVIEWMEGLGYKCDSNEVTIGTLEAPYTVSGVFDWFFE